MGVQIDTAMVLAAGLGTRMRPLTNNRPKPLVRVCGTPLIDYTLTRFQQAGLSRAIVNVHYLADQMENHLTTYDGLDIIISDERDQLLETGGGLIKARASLGEGPVFCTNTDAILMDEAGHEACAALTDVWDDAVMDALLLLAELDNATGYEGRGDFALAEDGRLAWPSDSQGAPVQIFTGLQILHPRLFAGEEVRPVSTRLFWERAMSAGRLYGITHQGLWMHVGDPAGLKAAEKILSSGAAER